MKNNKKFDSVKMMRSIRDELSKKFIEMSYLEQKKYLNDQLKKSKIIQVQH